MKLRVYRSLLGPSFRRDRDKTYSAIAALRSQAQPWPPAPVRERRPDDQPLSLPGHSFDGVVLGLKQLENTLLHSPCRGNDNVRRNDDFGFICQLPVLLDPTANSSTSSGLWEDAIKEPLEKLSELLQQVDRERKTTTCRPILDMVILAPVFKDGGCVQEYLSSVLPLGSLFLESAPHSSVGINDGRNSLGGPLGQHVKGIGHYFGDAKDLGDLEEVADIFPPTRFVLHPKNLRTAASDINDPNTHQQHAPLSALNPFGLSMGLEAVVYNTDALRASPSSFHVHRKKPGDNGRQPHGVFGAGTVFGEVWCAQCIEGAKETYVICDDDDDNATQDDDSYLVQLAHDVREAYAATGEWRSGAEERRREELNEASKELNKRKKALTSGRYGADVEESARRFGLAGWGGGGGGGGDGSDKALPLLTTEAIRKRWQVLAFQSHPDAANGAATKTMTFAESRRQFLTLMRAAKQGEE